MHHLLLLPAAPPLLRQTDNIHGRQLRIGIISRRYFDNVRAHEVDSVQTADNRA